MRLRRLVLSRYGMFTDHALDFGERNGDGPDLHLVYGLNEAGKSTALAGFLDLLFGIEQQSRYKFLHGYEAMRIDSDLEIDGRVHRFARIRRKRESLVDEHGRPVADGVLVHALGGMTREAYRAMFSLDDETLEEGGEEILRSEGDLGQLLFASSAGLVELTRALKGLRQGAEQFHRGGLDARSSRSSRRSSARWTRRRGRSTLRRAGLPGSLRIATARGRLTTGL